MSGWFILKSVKKIFPFSRGISKFPLFITGFSFPPFPSATRTVFAIGKRRLRGRVSRLLRNASHAKLRVRTMGFTAGQEAVQLDYAASTTRRQSGSDYSEASERSA